VKSLALLLGVGVLSLCPSAWAQSPSQSSFGALKNLAGTWTGRVTTDPPNPEIDGSIQVTIRVASRGNVLVHEIAPGGVPEPTLIFLERDRLTLVHYCEAGNRPRMVARRSPDPKIVEFDFVELSGKKGPAYLHHFRWTILSADHHTEDWTFMLPGDKRLHAHFDLKRAKGDAPPPAGK